jgi:hypothetical protein
MIRVRSVLFPAILILLLPLTVFAETYIGTYEVSYAYNATTDPDNKPTGSVSYGSVMTQPVYVPLSVGSYAIKTIAGRITGNEFIDHGWADYLKAYYDYIPLKNPGSSYPDMGYNGGCTAPTSGDPNDPSSWWTGAYAWVGSSAAAGANVGATFDIGAGQSLWLYWPDPWIYDNLGGTTLEIWRTSNGTVTVPEPAVTLLLGLGLVMLAGIRRFFPVV